MKSIYYVFGIIVMSGLTGCGGDSSTVIPTPKIPQGDSAVVALLLSGNFDGAGNQVGTSTLVSSQTFQSKAPSQLDTSSLTGKAWLGILSFSFSSERVAILFKISANQLEVAVSCLGASNTNGVVAGDKLFPFPVKLDGNVIYLQNAFAIKTEDSQGNYCEAIFSGDYIQFSGSSGNITVKLNGFAVPFTPVNL